MLAFNHKKMPLKKYKNIYYIYVVCTLYIWRLNVKLLQYKSMFKHLLLITTNISLDKSRQIFEKMRN